MTIPENIFNMSVAIWMALGIIVFGILFKVSAPYGRYISNKWGLLVNNRAGWIVMEFPPLLLVTVFFFTGSAWNHPVAMFLYACWMLHYINRDIIFPFRLKTKGKKMPAAIMVFALFFNGFNGFFNGYYLGNFADFPVSWFYDPRFVSGCVLFVAGFIINNHSDHVLISLRKNDNGYQIPYGGMYKYVSCPNYFGEIVEWSGFAMMAWGLAPLSFLVWTVVNLLPRAVSHHKWYRRHFGDEYPSGRRALVPFIL